MHDIIDQNMIKEILRSHKVIAVVGLSSNPEKDSYRVAAYLQRHGYKIIPVNPGIEEVLGEKSYPNLSSIPEKIDVVDVFRRSEHVPEVVREAIAVGAKVLWLQLGVVNDEAAEEARKAGVTVVQDKCMMQELARLA
ncbi:CoA-binding protein [Desulfomonile tiedjei]|uniref:Putative CoA-binding protein n=1 Tax=Desulfomonile tiedjei (strain ATCC 49306 / DSM 6799 / DCB-1) TaxID=706587 RepID=I4CDL5_DESTA|nr:CoA-binding protein [Desulfomonile tiedjei]AFM27656.1 putative CoA-binding protein [Desulfomonile tiedjei DSM 6799]